MSVTDFDVPLESDLSEDDLDMDVYESFSAVAEPGQEAVAAIGSADAEDYEFMDDDLLRQEDPYIQDLLGPLTDQLSGN